MADEPVQRSTSSPVFDSSVLFGEDIEEILAKLDTQRRCDVIDQLTDTLDMSSLMDVRLKIFRFAKKKLVNSVDGTGNKDVDPVIVSKTKPVSQGDVQKLVDEWGLIARKSKARVAMDTVEFMSYINGDYTFFPAKCIKKRVTTRKRGKKKGAKSRDDPEQPRIPFATMDKEKPSEVSVTEANTATPVMPGNDTDDLIADSMEDTQESDMFETSSEEADEGDTDYETPSNEINDEVVTIMETNEVDSTVVNDTPDEAGMSNPPTPGDSLYPSAIEPPLPAVPLPTPDSLHYDSEQQQTPIDLTSNSVSVVVYDKATPICPEKPTRPAGPEMNIVGSNRAEQADPVMNTANNISAEQPVAKVTPASTPVPQAVNAIECDKPGFWDSHLQPGVCTSAGSVARQQSSNAVTMSSQTEWDLWGSPKASDCARISSSYMRSHCDCADEVKRLKDWRREHERQSEITDHSNRAKLNSLRQKLIESEEDRGKMKGTISSLSKQIADNAAAIAEFKARSAMAHQSADGGARNLTLEMPTERPAPRRGPVAPKQNNNNNPNHNNGGRGRGSAQNTALSADIRMLKQVPLFNSPITNAGANAAKVHTPAGPSMDRFKAGTGAPKQGTKQPNVQSRGVNTASNVNDAGEARASQMANREKTPNVRQNQAAGNKGPVNPQASNYSIFGSSRQQVTSRSVSTSAPSPTQPSRGRAVASDSWADDPVSDIELIAITDAVDGGVSVSNAATPSVRSGDNRERNSPTSRVNLLRNAINTSMQKEMRATQNAPQRVSTAVGPSPGDKRGYDGTRDQPESQANAVTYASAAEGDWSDYETKRRKRGNSGNNVPELHGVKPEAQRDIFVRHLSYARCRKPEDLELIVKHHCRRRNVEIIFARAYVRSNDRYQANCKVTLKESDVDKALSRDFWPEYVKARPWLTKDQYNQANRQVWGSDEEPQFD